MPCSVELLAAGVAEGNPGLTCCVPCPSLLAPVFLTELQNQEVLDGYPVSFDCVVTGQPVPTVRWFKDGRMLEEDDHYMISEDQQGGHQLIITAVVPADMGVYRCLAENSVGVSSTKAELRVDRKCTFGCEDSGRAGVTAVTAGAGLEDYQPSIGLRSGRIWGWKVLWQIESSLGAPLRGKWDGEEPGKIWRYPMGTGGG